MAFSLSITDFLNTFNQMVATRGTQEEVTSDNGRIFVGADRELTELTVPLEDKRTTQRMPETLPPVDLLPVTAPATPIAIPEVVPILTLSEDAPGVQLNTTPSTSAEQQGELTPTDQNDFFSHEELFEIRTKAASVKNFAVHLTRMLFQPEELRGRNVRGVAGKQPLNPDKVKVIMDAVCKFYPAPPEGRDFQWRDCRKAVDTYLRGIKFSERNQ